MAAKCNFPFEACYHSSYRLSASLARSSNLLGPEKRRSNGKLPMSKNGGVEDHHTLSIDLKLAPPRLSDREVPGACLAA